MTEAECAKVLAKIQLVDNRQVDRLTLTEWFDIIGHLDFQDAIGAVREHRQTSTEYLQPAHIVLLAKRSALERAKRSTQLELEAYRSARDRSVPMPDHLREQMLGGRHV